ncbi:MAG: cytochrome P450 [Solirubrobacterales bacterium]|nr:cytochrome P450 [Solirubrobacterales bacterium]
MVGLSAGTLAARLLELPTIELTVNSPPDAPAAPLAPDPLPPGPRGPAPLVFANFLFRPGAFLEGTRDRYGTPFTLRLSSERTVVLTDDPATIKQVFTSDPTKLLAGVGNEVLKPLLGPRSVLTLDDPEHMRQRKLLLPPFHGERMRLYEEVVRTAAERELARWPAGEPFAVQPSMQAITLEVIMRAVFGISERGERFETIAAPLRDALDAMADMRRLFVLQVASSKRNGPLSPWRRFREQLLHPADRVLYDEIAAARSDPARAERDDVLALLLAARDEDGAGLTDAELHDELLTLLLAGHETTATSLSWTLERLARHPQALARLTEEVRAGEGDDYLDAVVKESLRLRPVVPAVARYLTEPTELGGRVLPAGVHIAPSIYLTHRNPDVYEDPDRFFPERFLQRPTGTYDWIPFGGGTRRCLGATFALFEMKIVLEELLRRFDVAPETAPAERIARRAITFSPRDGGRVRVAPVTATAR